MDRGSGTPFWKIAVGVMVGVLLADVARVAWAMFALNAFISTWGVTFDKPSKITEGQPRSPAVAPAAPARSSGLEGPATARRRGLDRACINGVIAEWRDNEWTQFLADGSVRGCRAKSP